jgi:RNA polymerase sigma-B factor
VVRGDSSAVGSVEERLAQFRASGDRRIRNQIVEEMRPVAEACARELRRGGEPLEDLAQVAMVGVLKAAERFDPTRGVPFASFAAVTARGELRRYYRDATGVARVPRRLHDLVPSIAAASDELRARLGRSPVPAEVAAYLHITTDEVVEVTARTTSAWEPLPSDEAPLPGAAHFAWEDGLVAAMDDRAKVGHLLGRLPPELQEVVRLRYVLGLTWAQIAEITGTDARDVRSDLRRATRRLRAGTERGRQDSQVQTS